MEQDLNTLKNDIFENQNFFQLDHKGQNIRNNLEFKKWNEDAQNYIKKINNQRKEAYISSNFYGDKSMLTIEFCDNCISYTICSLSKSLCYIKCNKCQEEFCIGCSRKNKYNEDRDNETVCLRGYLKGLYLRIINRRSELVNTIFLFHIMHIIFCLFFTPLFIGFISNYMGLIIHRNKKRVITDDFLSHGKNCFYFIYSFFRGILMFPYITLFLPFMIILLLPGIFSYTYYLHVFDSYIATVWPGDGPLCNVGDY